jgi:RimJ/RimL family protein N-acetyltransferase
MIDIASTHRLNEYCQPIGAALPNWTACPRPARITLQGRYCTFEPLDAARHTADLYAANSADSGRMWTYLPYGPFADLGDYRAWVARVSQGDDPLFFAIIEAASQAAIGVSSLMRIDPSNGTIEVGHIAYSPRLQRTPAATEAMFLLMLYAFELGYRRYEWKCDALNAPSRAAAQRLGFSYEGIFRQAVVYKGRSRDTAWYAIIDTEWPALRAAFKLWLEPPNFDADGRQRARLSNLTAPIRSSRA